MTDNKQWRLERRRELADAKDRLVEYLRRVAGPALTAQAAQEVLVKARAWHPVTPREPDAFLVQHPDALTAPPAHCPHVLVRLRQQFEAAGHGSARDRLRLSVSGPAAQPPPQCVQPQAADARPRVAGHQRPQHRHDRSPGRPASDRHQRPLRSSPGHSPDLGPVRRRQLGRLPCPPERPIVLASPGVRESHETGAFGASGNGAARGFAGVLAAIRRQSATQGSPTPGQALPRPSTRCQIMA